MSKNDTVGGSLDIPDGWFVYHADFDCVEPYIDLYHEDNRNEKLTLKVPKSLAYYLSSHFCGSNKMRNLIIANAEYSTKEKVRDALGLTDEYLKWISTTN